MTNETNNGLANKMIAEAKFGLKVLDMVENASTHEDLNEIGAKINYAVNNKMKYINIAELQYQASKKMREIYNKIGVYVPTD